jgi:HlyD family secretion protein
MKPNNVKWLAISIGIAAVGAMALWSLWSLFFESQGPGQGFVSGNGRVEATEIDVASKLAGRIE